MATIPHTLGFPSPFPDPVDVQRSKLSTILLENEFFPRTEWQAPVVKIGRSFGLAPLQNERITLQSPVGPRGPVLRGLPLIPHDLPAG